jgi:predicted RecB family nuclease
MAQYEDEGFDSETARQATEDAIRVGEDDVIYQAYLSDGTWRGFADFLEKVEEGSGPGMPGPYGKATYEPVDTKLARSAKPLHILQLCFYAEQLERIQGRLPEEVHVELGTGVRESFHTADYIAFFRRSRERFRDAIDGGSGPSHTQERGMAEARPRAVMRLAADGAPVTPLRRAAGTAEAVIPRPRRAWGRSLRPRSSCRRPSG